ncbi:sentrin-specific protease 8-like protein [Dinothrombium tinctorium]|uniref:Sentrin-specific protease 8-like protein n=1 Tax=Dinothrombium tinctorium TaxID=1965070 RepID=A0A3S3P4I7_9ACAR|nr:sentrin-specific protease 8-like protein [Dinothrombium tinctorium]RWS15182.1 sentrin-specific protease 8-like protein [Dinothrombium tinctorium]
MGSEGDIVLSYGDTLLRTSDVSLLNPGHWINDNLIAFWFEYLERELYKDVASAIAFISPQVAHFIKSGASNHYNIEEIRFMLESSKLSEKQLILLPINDCITYDTCGGSHWSLLTYKASNQSFEHYDSYTGSINRTHAEQLVTVLSPFLTPGREIDLDLDLSEMECTQQMNGYDCGIHVICNADAVCRKLFRGDESAIYEIASESVIKEARRKILRIIYDLQKNQ